MNKKGGLKGRLRASAMWKFVVQAFLSWVDIHIHLDRDCVFDVINLTSTQ